MSVRVGGLCITSSTREAYPSGWFQSLNFPSNPKKS
jgi:hypothetical protein